MNCTTEGKFGDALKSFRQCIQLIPLLVATNKGEEAEAQKLVKSSAEYITGMRCILERQKQPAEVKVA